MSKLAHTLGDLDQHTLIEIYVWGEQMCTEHRQRKIPEEVMGGGFVIMQGRRRRHCPWCWEELRKSAEGKE